MHQTGCRIDGQSGRSIFYRKHKVVAIFIHGVNVVFISRKHLAVRVRRGRYFGGMIFQDLRNDYRSNRVTVCRSIRYRQTNGIASRFVGMEDRYFQGGFLDNRLALGWP